MISNSGTSTLGLYDLKRQIDAFGGVDYFRPNLAGGYLLNARVMLANGDIVKSTTDGNTADPNVNMTGWKPTKDSNVITTVESVADLIAIQNPKDGQVVSAKSYYSGLNAGGRKVSYDSSKSSINDGVFIFNGWVSEEIITLTPDYAGAKPNDVTFDNTTALNKAFATGKDIYSTPDKTYYVSGILNSKGQKCLGGWTINSSRSDGSTSGKLGLAKTTTDGVDSLSIRMLYLESAYDLAELFIIKSLGFNTINHYGYFENNPVDADGTVQKLLDNCLTVGLQVNLGTESQPAQDDINAFINNSKNHPALWGYSVYDEPASRGISVAQQDYKIDMLRSLTSKSLSFVDLITFGGAFNQLFSTRYDIAFVDSYSLQYTTGTLAEWLEKDLEKMRYDFGCIKAMTKINRIYPVVAAYSMATYYSDNIDQVIQASRIFGTIAEGNFGAFVWDGVGDAGVLQNVRKNSRYRDLCIELNSQKVRKKLHTDTYLFGGAPSATYWGLDDLTDNLITKDPFTISDNVWGSAYPSNLSNGTSETDRTSPSIASAHAYGGIGMKGTYSALPTLIQARNNIRVVIELAHVDPIGKSGTFYLMGTSDNGYSVYDIFVDGYSENKVFNFSSTPQLPNDNLVFKVESATDTTTFYRKFLRGIVICTSW